MDVGETVDSSAFDKLFKRNVPHIVEMIFLSLDFESFLRCLKVSKEWNKLLTSASFKMKCRSVFQEEICIKVSLAIGEGSIEKVKRLLSTEMVDMNYNMRNWRLGQRSSYLFRAIYSGHTDVLTLLLENGADPNVVLNGITPLMYAARCSKNDIVRVLLNKGADPSGTQWDPKVSAN